MSLPWKEAAKHYRNKCRVARRKSERQRDQITMLLRQSKGRRELNKIELNRLEKQIAKLEKLIEEVTGEVKRNQE
ncbi:hypothetical protein LCGC14_1478520 [marine sediment metagenome]|uniref:Uncharacterized protein n=1 Tax=marine sediment metagenome TaxID=412755 RepID=A0A0F9LQL5_9ZZZZ